MRFVVKAYRVPWLQGWRPLLFSWSLGHAGALDLAVAYLKNYAVDKADALYAATKPFCTLQRSPNSVFV